MSRQQARRTVRLALLYPLFVAALIAAIVPMAGLNAQDEPHIQIEPVQPEPDAQPEPEPQTLTEQLGGEDRYLTHISTDKPIYRAGETVFVRGTILHAFSHRPYHVVQQELAEQAQREQAQQQQQEAQADADQDRPVRIQPPFQQQLMPTIEIKDATGATIATSRSRVEDSVFGFSWVVPEGQAGGQYTVKVSYPWSGLAPVERTFDIRAYRAPRIRSQIEFLQDGYGPGDTVVATLEATRAEGGIPEGAQITAIARVDGVEVARVQSVMSQTGTAEARFDLPAQITRGEGSLTFVIQDGGVVETATKTLPILLQTVDLQLFPEGGDLVAGVPNRVYFEARTPYGDPADISGVIVVDDPHSNQAGPPPVLAEFSSTHEGRGVFSFTPEAGHRYVLHVTEPSSVTQTFELPPAIAIGAVVSTGTGVFDHDESINISVTTNGQQVMVVEVRQREQVVAREMFFAFGEVGVVNTRGINFTPISDERLAQLEAGPGELGIGLFLRDSVSGILTVTAYDADYNPVAERLIYRAPQNRVNVQILPDSAQYTPAGHVQLTIRTTDQDGNPISAVTGLTVTDDSVLEMIQTREQAPALPAMVLLEQEVRELADAHVYLDPSNEDAAQQLDLLLGTQGWRRFALVNVEDFIVEHGDDARRLLALRVPSQPEIQRLQARAAQFEEGAVFALGGADAAAFDAPQPAAAPDNNKLEVQNELVADGAGAFDQAPPAAERDIAQALIQADEARQDDQLIAGDAARRQIAAPQMVYVREYAHAQPAGKPFGQRSDFTETVYWSAHTRTNDEGLATVEFDLSDSVTSFRVNADAFTDGGALGEGTELIESVRPFYIEPKLPLELTAGDTVLLPIAVVNNTDEQNPLVVQVSNVGRVGNGVFQLNAFPANLRERMIYELEIGETFGDIPFTVQAHFGNYSDQNRRTLRVVPRGFPIDNGSGGMLQPDSEVGDDITIPDTIVPGSLQATVTVYPSPMANLTEALEALIREPNGCFEQTSSSVFPMVMAQQYFLTHQGIDPQLIADAREKLGRGYDRLISFETDQDGYEWFGASPPHEALTAYGLLEFTEMSRVMDVDQAMIDRTADWLLSRVNAEGSFELNERALDSFGRAPQETTNAYIVWSMLEAGYDPTRIQASIDLVLGEATTSSDAYIVALGANIALLTERDERGALLTKLAGMLNDEGYVEGAVTSITRSGGDALNIETTSLAILAWLKDDAYTEQVEASILWLTERCKAGRFGSTQSTVLALKAIVAYDTARSTPTAPGTLTLVVDGQVVGQPVAFNEETKGAIYLPALADRLTPGQHTIAVRMQDGSKMPYSIAITYSAETPASSDDCALRIETAFPLSARTEVTLSDAEGNERDGHLIHADVAEGETTEINVTVTNITDEGLPTPLAIVGIPGGLEPDYDQLKQLVDAGTIAAFEVLGRDVVLYWREMAPNQIVELPIRCVAAVPGTYTGPASRTYLYYTDELKDWTDGLVVNITPR